ncbi:peptide/nickel transport system permease protein [Nitrosomonas cryotolerans]|uniref:Peptide/nickel transport system permease protein n=1 Tax=Nitrosomonas cryotolerans ATCC 49181 TaxID=1131553 RepID=A0A1N6JI94_9PROT|nr:ABC transporter permease [Nitrosomonas cryotolerans]SFP88972.1 peptide/nickel transport system permease protein [Nitrosomonas cryotolerans]SIO44000.1 peptide/nickel transport system permease protein [Nitrosomonas cryotolerans ATCC 49181]
MPISPVILWTDALIYLLVIIVIAFAWSARKNKHLLDSWQRVCHSTSGMVSLTVLCFFITIGLLDTLHFRPALENRDHQGEIVYSVEVLSLFDVIVTPLRTRVEKTYSAPLATHLYTKENVDLPDGKRTREFTRLEFGGAHLQHPETQHKTDILWRTAKGIGLGLLIWAGLTLCLSIILARRNAQSLLQSLSAIGRGATEIPWRAILITLAIILSLAGAASLLSTHYHVLGTDKVGQDTLYQALKSIRTGLVIGTLTTLIMLPFALLLGITAGYFRGWIDDVIQYTYTTLGSIPSVLLIAAAVLIMQVYIETHPDLFDTSAARADLRLLFLCVILGITSWTGLCRLLRGETLKLREMEYIQAAHAFGVSHWRIISRHILPNVMHIVLIVTVMDFSGLILAEAVLSYVGVGVDPSMTSFGNMINAARLEMAREPMVWWALFAAFSFMFTLVLCANLFADAVQNAFDPRTRTSPSKIAISRHHKKQAVSINRPASNDHGGHT